MGNKTNSFSIIDKELTVDGKLSTKGRLIIRGQVKGTLVADTVIVAEKGSVYADTEVSSMTIGGTFEGEIRASDELIILPTGHCTGKVSCKDLVVEPGGILNAEVACVAMHDSRPVKKQEPGKGDGD